MEVPHATDDVEQSMTRIARALESALPRQVTNHPPASRAGDPRDREDSWTRQAYGTGGKRPWGRGLRAAFYASLPPTPLGPVTHDEARLYLAAIIACRERGCWSQREQEKLRMIHRRWEARVAGEDRRFAALGGVFSGRREVKVDTRLDDLRREVGA